MSKQLSRVFVPMIIGLGAVMHINDAFEFHDNKPQRQGEPGATNRSQRQKRKRARWAGRKVRTATKC